MCFFLSTACAIGGTRWAKRCWAVSILACWETGRLYASITYQPSAPSVALQGSKRTSRPGEQTINSFDRFRFDCFHWNDSWLVKITMTEKVRELERSGVCKNGKLYSLVSDRKCCSRNGSLFLTRVEIQKVLSNSVYLTQYIIIPAHCIVLLLMFFQMNVHFSSYIGVWTTSEVYTWASPSQHSNSWPKISPVLIWQPKKKKNHPEKFTIYFLLSLFTQNCQNSCCDSCWNYVQPWILNTFFF